VDFVGQRYTRSRNHESWLAGYFAMCPDYRITCEHMLVVAVGSAGGTIVVSGDLLPENQWNIPAAWRAVGEGRLIPYKGVASLRR